MIIELNKLNFKPETGKGLKLVEFYTKWCGYCKKQTSELEKMDKIWIGRIDADENKELAEIYNVNAFPTFIILKDGEILERFSGLRTKEDIMNRIIKYF